MPKTKRFCVSISCKSIKYFYVNAEDKEQAEELAEDASANGVDPDDYWESEESVEKIELAPEPTKPTKPKRRPRPKLR